MRVLGLQMVACTVDFGHGGGHIQLSRWGSAQYDTSLLLKFTAQPQLAVVTAHNCRKGSKTSSQLQQPAQQPALNLESAIKHAMETMPICFSIFEWDG